MASILWNGGYCGCQAQAQVHGMVSTLVKWDTVDARPRHKAWPVSWWNGLLWLPVPGTGMLSILVE